MMLSMVVSLFAVHMLKGWFGPGFVKHCLATEHSRMKRSMARRDVANVGIRACVLSWSRLSVPVDLRCTCCAIELSRPFFSD
mmetsp:Transcript_49088/g.129987  ORF Transcript_49088/g.129987 Transcript_49088/m.129987 type:complete len:82 (-) Transcript_49088:94-339(-)